MKRIVSILLFMLMLAPMTFAAPAGVGALNLRMIYTVKSDTLGDATYTIYANAIAFPIAQDDEAMYLLTDGSLYEFDTAVIAAADEIGKLFEDAGITGIEPENYAAEFEVMSADIGIVYNSTVYNPILMYASDTYAVLMLTDAPDIAIPAYIETLPESTVSFYGVTAPGYGIADKEPALSETLTSIEAGMSDKSGTMYVDKPFTYENLGSPLLAADGTICGLIYYDAAAQEINGAVLSGLQEELATLGITVNPIGGAQEPVTTHVASQTTTQEPSAVTTAAEQTSSPATTEELAKSANFRTLIIYATCIAGALMILIIILMIMRTRTAKPDREVEKLRREEPFRENLARPAAAVRTVEPEAPRIRREPEHVRVPANDNYSRPRYEMPRASAPAVIARQDNDATRRIPSAPVTQAPPRSVMLAVLDGNLQGYTLNIIGTAVLGRDPKLCQVVFGATQTEISRRHCQITYKPLTGEIVLEDLNSANGTYTPDGRRYAAGRKYLLRSGDRFCLGTRENMVEVR
ncbi:MAG: FHA domain-containing protein [Clostridiaceae bacterium]|nr:FHA domain-containing protein [Clostridiaceae bacterium]